MAKYEHDTFCKLGEFHTYVHTTKEIDPAAFAVHHISYKVLIGAPPFPTAITQFKEWVVQSANGSRVVLVAHNGKRFDDIMLFCNFYIHNLCFDTFLKDINCYGFADSLRMLRELCKGCPQLRPRNPSTNRVSFTLGHCYATYCRQLTLDGAHDALVDSRALYDIFTSELVSAHINISALFRFVDNREKSCKWIRQSAGLRFTEPAVVLQTDERQHDCVQVPKWYEPTGGDGYTLCLNCVVFSKPRYHTCV